MTELAFIAGGIAVLAVALDCEQAAAGLFGLCMFLLTKG